MYPACTMKLTPLARLSRSCLGERPARMEGVQVRSVSVKSHCFSDWVSGCIVDKGCW